MSKDSFAFFREGYRHVLRIEGEKTSGSLQKKVKREGPDEEVFVFDGTESS
jgi:hypothetical protein